jgi:O-methyltransferase involved in polyketide biosynthesis
MQKGKIYLTKEKETYLATLYGKALDSCEFRIDPPYTVRWYDIDMPDVIKLRRRLYPERHDYTLVGSSVTDLHWLDEIPADRPVLVVAEGLVQYLSEKEGLALFNRITEKFPSGEFIFDAYSRLTIKLISLLPTAKEAHVSLKWGINDPYELEKQVPHLKLVTSISFLFMPELVERLSMSQSWVQRMIYHIMGHIGFLRRSILHLRYQF